MNTRRDFIKYSALASASLMMPNFLKGLGQQNLHHQGKKLIIIQLSGGNDGLNSCVPYRNDIYYRSRMQLGIPQNKVLKLSDEMGLNPAMTGLRNLYEQGLLSILNSVGYPNPNRSHFRAMDIWHTGSHSDEYWETGWLGRYMDNSCVGCAEPHKVLEVDDTLSLAVKGNQAKALALSDPARLYKTTQDKYLRDLVAASQEHKQKGRSDLDYLYKTMAETMESAEYVYETSKVYKSRLSYPNGRFAKQLKTVAELICSGIDSSVFYVSLAGFDTHVHQKGQQERLLTQYSEAVAALVKDLKQNRRLEETLIMTFSEFGRRVAQNASGGTDHGKANNLFLIGGKLQQAGMYNEAPNLAQLDDGDVRWQIDFRQVYATLLHDWLGVDDEEVLGRAFTRLALV